MPQSFCYQKPGLPSGCLPGSSSVWSTGSLYLSEYLTAHSGGSGPYASSSAQGPSPGRSHLNGPETNYINGPFLLEDWQTLFQSCRMWTCWKALVKFFMLSSWAKSNPSNRGSCQVFEMLSIFYNFDLEVQDILYLHKIYLKWIFFSYNINLCFLLILEVIHIF